MANRAPQEPRVGIAWACLVALLASLAWLIPGCSQKETFSPYLDGGLGTDSLFADTTLASVAEWTAASGQSAGDAYKSKRLVVANWDGYVSRVFLNFALYPDTSVEVTSATLFLYITRVEGDAGPSTFGLHALSDSLVQIGLRWGTKPDAGDEIGSFGVGSEPEDSVVLDVTGTVAAWAGGTSTNRGFMIRCRDEFTFGERIVEFASNEDVSTRELADADSTTIRIRPVLRVVSIDSEDSTEFTELAAAIDTFADTLTTARSDTALTVANGFPSRTYVRFDYAGIPREATITRAVLKLTADTSSSSFDSMTVICYAVLDTVSGFDAAYGYAGSATKVLKRAELTEDPSFSIEVTPIIQTQVSQFTKGNYGLVVKSTDEPSDLDYVVIVPTRAGQPDLAPKLEIHYTLPPRPWYRRD